MEFILGIGFFALLFWLGREHERGNGYKWVFGIPVGIMALGWTLGALGYGQ